MKHILYILIGVTIFFSSCDKEESNNGDLEGFWQMTTMSNKPDAFISDMRSSGITWAFQGHILELRDVNKINQDIIMSFKHEGNTLKLMSPYLVARDSGDISISDVSFLMPYGINDLEEEYLVIELSSSLLVLENNICHLEFRKY